MVSTKPNFKELVTFSHLYLLSSILYLRKPEVVEISIWQSWLKLTDCFGSKSCDLFPQRSFSSVSETETASYTVAAR